MAAYVVAGDDREVDVKAEYAGLQNKTVAVLVSIDSDTALHYKTAQADLCRAISRHISQQVPGSKLVNPDQIVVFQEANPYWPVQPTSQVLKALHTERIIAVDVGRYSDHDPGNSYEWRGLIQANINVYAADATDVDDRVYATILETRFPETEAAGTLDIDARLIQQGLCEVFAQKVAMKFCDHSEVRK